MDLETQFGRRLQDIQQALEALGQQTAQLQQQQQQHSQQLQQQQQFNQQMQMARTAMLPDWERTPPRSAYETGAQPLSAQERFRMDIERGLGMYGETLEGSLEAPETPEQWVAALTEIRAKKHVTQKDFIKAVYGLMAIKDSPVGSWSQMYVIQGKLRDIDSKEYMRTLQYLSTAEDPAAALLAIEVGPRPPQPHMHVSSWGFRGARSSTPERSRRYRGEGGAAEPSAPSKVKKEK